MRARALLAAISPCPNDTFAFYPWACGLVDTPFPLNVAFHDIETLNILAQDTAPYQVTKLSSACFGSVANRYVALSSGAAFATHGGPVVVSKTAISPGELSGKTLAIPGRHTSAYLAFLMVHGKPKAIIEMPFHTILPRFCIPEPGSLVNPCDRKSIQR